LTLLDLISAQAAAAEAAAAAASLSASEIVTLSSVVAGQVSAAEGSAEAAEAAAMTAQTLATQVAGALVAAEGLAGVVGVAAANGDLVVGSSVGDLVLHPAGGAVRVSLDGGLSSSMDVTATFVNLTSVRVNDGGFIKVARVTTTQKNALASPVGGQLVYDTTLNALSVYDGTSWRTLTMS
jgi:hypothetical protein